MRMCGGPSHAHRITQLLCQLSPQNSRSLPLPACCRTLIDSFAIPEHLVAAPIAGDWARYNAADNQGELLGQAW